MGNGYEIFLMIELARCVGLIDKKLEYDLTWNKGCELYQEFETSEFNDTHKPEYDCMVNFLKSKKHIWELKIINEHGLEEGWNIFYTNNEEGHNEYEVQRIDENPRFLSDNAAIMYIHKQAVNMPDGIHQKAIRWLHNNCPDEFERCINVVKEILK
jgi:hypothetical protein